MAADMLQRVFAGSASQLMIHALAGHRASPEEVEELHRVLNAYKGDKDDKLK
jgi:predicted transcriptional regulator